MIGILCHQWTYDEPGYALRLSNRELRLRLSSFFSLFQLPLSEWKTNMAKKGLWFLLRSLNDDFQANWLNLALSPSFQWFFVIMTVQKIKSASSSLQKAFGSWACIVTAFVCEAERVDCDLNRNSVILRSKIRAISPPIPRSAESWDQPPWHNSCSNMNHRPMVIPWLFLLPSLQKRRAICLLFLPIGALRLL